MEFPTALDTARALVAALEDHAADPTDDNHDSVITISDTVEFDVATKPWH